MLRTILLTVFSLLLSLPSEAIIYPSISICFDAQAADNQSVSKSTTPFEGSAPIEATFYMTVTNPDEWDMTYEWRFCHEGESLENPYMTRYEENPTVIFTNAGTDSIALYCVFKKEGYPDFVIDHEFYDNDVRPLTIKASESMLTFPNAFSPNSDGINDTFKPKTYKSIVEFKATIFNRWGQKLYEWTDVTSEGWDGSYNGKQVKDGTYFILCVAKGADGRQYNIKKDVNILRGFEKLTDQ